MAAASAKTKQTTTVELVVPMRRNYHTRTYSGAILLRSDYLGDISRRIHKSVDSLSWHSPRNINQFPILRPLDRDTEMKIMDIVLGDDPLQEGLIVEDDNKNRAQLAEKNLNDALVQSGSKRYQLQQR
jgi:hypothetical protein